MIRAFVVFSLLGDYSHVADEIEKELFEAPEPCEEKECEFEKADARFLEQLSAKELQELCIGVVKANTGLKEENALLREELDDLYPQYDAMAASFGEVSQLLKEAAAVLSK